MADMAGRILGSLHDLTAELEVLSEEGVLEALPLRDIEMLFVVERRLCELQETLTRILRGERAASEVFSGVIADESHPIVKMLIASRRQAREDAVKLRRSFLKVVED